VRTANAHSPTNAIERLTKSAQTVELRRWRDKRSAIRSRLIAKVAHDEGGGDGFAMLGFVDLVKSEVLAAGELALRARRAAKGRP
jgi:hypothetical protein